MGLMASCSPDQNDWNTDPSAKRQYAPASLSAEIDSFSLAMTIKIGTLESAASYEVQFSQQPLLSGFDETEGIPTISTTTGEVTIERDDPRLGEKGIVENAVYYVRARAIGSDGSKSKWYSNGFIYNEGYVSDASLVELLKKKASNKISAPAGLWITGIEENSMKVNWYMLPKSSSKAERAYCKAPSYIINETLKEEGADESVYKHTLTPEELEAYIYEWTGLAVGKSYTFTLFDENNLQIGKATESTEYAPNMDLAMSVTVKEMEADVVIDPETGEEKTGKTMFTTKGEPYTIYSNEVDGQKMKVTFNNETAGGWTEGRNDWASSPVNKAINFNVRAQLKKNTSVDLEFPADGRLYIYAYNSSANTNTLTQDGQEPQEFSVISTKQKIETVDDPETTQNAYISYKLRVVKGKASIHIDNANSIYFFGFCFVPNDPNAGK